jgi:hypothetical protein
MKKLEIFIQPTIANSCLRTLPGTGLRDFTLSPRFKIYFNFYVSCTPCNWSFVVLITFNLLYIVAFTFIILSCECVFIFLTDVTDLSILRCRLKMAVTLFILFLPIWKSLQEVPK